MSLFSDIEIETPQTTPLGGVHDEIIRAYGTPNGSGMSWRGDVLSLWGIATRGTKGWRSTLIKPSSLDEMEDAARVGHEHSIVSRRDNSVWLTGASSHLRTDVVELLHSLGYECIKDVDMEHQRIERYRR